MNLPNKLTVVRVLMIPFFVVFMLIRTSAGEMAAISGLHCNFLYCKSDRSFRWENCKKYNLVTNFGKFMDPLADKLLVSAAMICLVEMGRLPAWIVIIIISREFIISGFRLVASDNGIVIAASYWGKFKTVFQMVMIIVMIMDLGPSFAMLETILIYVALILTVVSLIDYVAKNKEVLTKGGM